MGGNLTSPRRRFAIEAAVIAVLVVLAFVFAQLAFARALSYPDYHYLSPAIGVATGRGFLDPVPAPGSALSQFLSSGRTSLPASEALAPEWREPDQAMVASRYLIVTIGNLWKWTGISWPALGWMAGGLHALLVIGAYGLFRQVVPLPLSALGAAWLALSTINLRLIPHVRDYSKGAFIVALLPFVVALAVAPATRWRLAALAAATGALAGIGIGFKMDVAIGVPLAAVSIVMFRDRRPWLGLADKGVALAALGVAFAAAAAPVALRLSSGGSNAIHVLLLGWAPSFDVSLGVDPALYTVLPFYSDGYVARMIQSRGLELTGSLAPFTSPEYDRASMTLWLDIARTMPGDVATRVLAAANSGLNLLFRNPDQTFVTASLPGAGVTAPIAAAFGRADGWGLWVAGAFVVAAGARSVRHGLLAGWLILAVGGYAFLQFADRHSFHVQVLPMAAVLGVTWAAIVFVTTISRQGAAAFAVPLRRGALVLAGVLIVLIAAVSLLRAIQHATLARELARVQRHSPVLVAMTIDPLPGGSVRLRWPEAAGTSPVLQPAYYLAEFRVDAPETLLMAIHYAAQGPDSDFSRVLALNATPGANLIGFATFTEAGQSTFDGLELGPRARARLTGVYRVSSGPAGLPLDVLLPADWRTRRLHQGVTVGRAAGASGLSRAGCGDRRGCGGLLSQLESLPAIPVVNADAMGMIHAPIVRVADGRVIAAGVVENESSYLFQMAPRTAAPGEAFVVEGTQRAGGAAIGLLKNGRWYKQVIVSEPGDFVLAIPIEDVGEVTPLVTNAMLPGRRHTNLEIRRAGFVPAVR